MILVHPFPSQHSQQLLSIWTSFWTSHNGLLIFFVTQRGRMITLVDFVKVKCPEASPKAKDFACACQQMNDVEAGWPLPCDEELQEPAAFPLFMSS